VVIITELSQLGIDIKPESTASAPNAPIAPLPKREGGMAPENLRELFKEINNPIRH
jgi:hypothetical protein